MINQALKQVYDLNVPVLFHVNGDAAIDSLLAAHEFAAAPDLGKPRNVTAIHAQFARKDQIGQFVQYNIRPSFYALLRFVTENSPLAMRCCHWAGPVMWALVPPASTATVTGISTTSNS